MCLHLPSETNTFVASDEHIHHHRQMLSLLETNAIVAGDKRIRDPKQMH